MKRHRQPWAAYLFVAVAVYIVVAMSVFRLRHPDMSETQLFLHLWDAMTWRAL